MLKYLPPNLIYFESILSSCHWISGLYTTCQKNHCIFQDYTGFKEPAQKTIRKAQVAHVALAWYHTLYDPKWKRAGNLNPKMADKIVSNFSAQRDYTIQQCNGNLSQQWRLLTCSLMGESDAEFTGLSVL